MKNKYLFDLLSGFPFDSNGFNSDGNGTPLIRIRDITAGHTSTFYEGAYDPRYVVVKDDLLIGMDGDFGLCWWQSENALLNQRCCKVMTSDSELKRYLYYALQPQLKAINEIAYSTTVKHLSTSDILNSETCVPPKDVMRWIVQFLDIKCSAIDSLIASKQSLLEKLEEYRKAVITKAVTKGIRPNVAMSKSSVGWLGDIPYNWNTNKISRLAATVSGSTPNTETKAYYENGQHPWVRTTDLNLGKLSDVPIKITDKALIDTTCKYVPKGTVLVAMYGGAGTIGKHSLLMFPATLNQAVCGIIPNKDLISEYLFYLAKAYSDLWISDAEGTRKDPNINKDVIRNWWIPVPPLSEQREIIQFIENIDNKINITAENLARSIAKLSEYRQSLITAAVTGKIDIADI